MQATIQTDWCLYIYPNGINNQNPEGDFIIGIRLLKLPGISDTIRVKSMTVLRRYQIPQIGLSVMNTDTFCAQRSWMWPQGSLKASQIATLRNDLNQVTFDVKVSISITSVEIERRLGLVMNNDNYNGKLANEASNEMLLKKLTQMESTMNEMMKQLKALNNMVANINSKDDRKENISFSDAVDDVEDNNINLALNEFKKWILSVFDTTTNNDNNSNNNKIGNQYVELIVNKEGFDNLDDFVQLNDDDLKEIGINKKGHRLKFLRKIQNCRQNKDMCNVSQESDTEGHTAL